MRAVLGIALVVALGSAAAAQNWSPQTGWDGQHVQQDFEARRDAMRAEHDARVRQMDKDFERDTSWMFGVFVAFTAGIIGVAMIAAVRGRRRRDELAQFTVPVEYAPAAHAVHGSIDVCTLRIGIDGRASKFVRTELEAIAKTYADPSPETRARKLREVSVMLRRVRDSWIYGGADNEPMRPREEAFASFARHVDEARTRVRKGAVPGATAQGPTVSLILVSVIVVARGELMTVTDLATGEDLRRALEAASHRSPDEILALDVVWVPDGDGQTLSSVDLEAVYRRAELHPLQGAVVGKVFCKYCNGPFPAELVSCPHCGGPAPGRA